MRFDDMRDNLSWSFRYTQGKQQEKELLGHIKDKVRKFGAKEYLIVYGKVIIIKKGLIYWKALDEDGNVLLKDKSLNVLKEMVKYL